MLSHLFDSLVRPVLEYGCETWGYVKAEEIEKVHRKFIKFALGLPSTAANLAIYGEVGRTPLDIRRNALMVKYWLRLTTGWEISPTWIHLRIPHWQHISKRCWKEQDFLKSSWVNPNLADQHAFIKTLQQGLQDQYTQALIFVYQNLHVCTGQ